MHVNFFTDQTIKQGSGEKISCQNGIITVIASNWLYLHILQSLSTGL